MMIFKLTLKLSLISQLIWSLGYRHAMEALLEKAQAEDFKPRDLYEELFVHNGQCKIREFRPDQQDIEWFKEKNAYFCQILDPEKIKYLHLPTFFSTEKLEEISFLYQLRAAKPEYKDQLGAEANNTIFNDVIAVKLALAYCLMDLSDRSSPLSLYRMDQFKSILLGEGSISVSLMEHIFAKNGSRILDTGFDFYHAIFMLYGEFESKIICPDDSVNSTRLLDYMEALDSLYPGGKITTTLDVAQLRPEIIRAPKDLMRAFKGLQEKARLEGIGLGAIAKLLDPENGFNNPAIPVGNFDPRQIFDQNIPLITGDNPAITTESLRALQSECRSVTYSIPISGIIFECILLCLIDVISDPKPIQEWTVGYFREKITNAQDGVRASAGYIMLRIFDRCLGLPCDDGAGNKPPFLNGDFDFTHCIKALYRVMGKEITLPNDSADEVGLLDYIASIGRPYNCDIVLMPLSERKTTPNPKLNFRDGIEKFFKEAVRRGVNSAYVNSQINESVEEECLISVEAMRNFEQLFDPSKVGTLDLKQCFSTESLRQMKNYLANLPINHIIEFALACCALDLVGKRTTLDGCTMKDFKEILKSANNAAGMFMLRIFDEFTSPDGDGRFLHGDFNFDKCIRNLFAAFRSKITVPDDFGSVALLDFIDAIRKLEKDSQIDVTLEPYKHPEVANPPVLEVPNDQPSSPTASPIAIAIPDETDPFLIGPARTDPEIGTSAIQQASDETVQTPAPNQNTPEAQTTTGQQVHDESEQAPTSNQVTPEAQAATVLTPLKALQYFCGPGWGSCLDFWLLRPLRWILGLCRWIIWIIMCMPEIKVNIQA